ncbi:hypothetical protein ES703_87588 [subsurface metagenome]
MEKLTMIGKCSNYTHTKYKGEDISEETFEYKGCWNCWQYFEYSDIFPYYDVEEASQRLGVSRNTIIRWIKKGKLEGRLFTMGAQKYVCGSHKKYFIKKESVDKIKNEGDI